MAARATTLAAAQQALLAELKAAAAQAGFRLREETLLREVGYHARSGRCRLRDEDILFLERGLPAGAQIELLAEELAARAFDNPSLSPAARTVLEQAAARGAERYGGPETSGR